MTSPTKPVPLKFPVAFSETPIVARINDTTLDEMETLFGKPQGLADPNDPSRIKRWAFHYPCGLSLVYACVVAYNEVLITADIPEVSHVARHLPFEPKRLHLLTGTDFQEQIDVELQTAPERGDEFDLLDIAQVWRQGDDGNKFAVGELTSERDAKCHVAELESHGHKQLYWYTLRRK